MLIFKGCAASLFLLRRGSCFFGFGRSGKISDEHSDPPKDQENGQEKIPEGNIELKHIAQKQICSDDDKQNACEWEFFHKY